MKRTSNSLYMESGRYLAVILMYFSNVSLLSLKLHAVVLHVGQNVR